MQAKAIVRKFCFPKGEANRILLINLKSFSPLQKWKKGELSFLLYFFFREKMG